MTKNSHKQTTHPTRMKFIQSYSNRLKRMKWNTKRSDSKFTWASIARVLDVWCCLCDCMFSRRLTKSKKRRRYKNRSSLFSSLVCRFALGVCRINYSILSLSFAFRCHSSVSVSVCVDLVVLKSFDNIYVSSRPLKQNWINFIRLLIVRFVASKRNHRNTNRRLIYKVSAKHFRSRARACIFTNKLM